MSITWIARNMLDHRRGPAPASSVGPQLLRGMISGRRSTHFRPPRANHTRIDTLIHNDSVAHREHVNGYIQHVLAHSTPSSVVAQPERPASAGSSSSETDVEVEELQQTISQLQEANEALQAEMQRVVHGLQELAEGAKRSHHSLRRASSALGTQVSPATPSLHVPLASGDNLTCVLQHPLCCTTTTVHEDVANQTATVTMQTTARATEGAAAKGMLTMEDLTALGTQALVGAAAEQLRTRAREVRSRSLGADIQRLHSELCRILRTGNIVHAQRNPVVSEFGHDSFVVQLSDSATGRHLRAIFKPRVPGDAGGWHRAPMEYVAYRLNLLVGLDYVPPTAYRTDGIALNIDGENITYPEGAMMLWVEEARQLNTCPERAWGMRKDVLLSDTRVLDVLLHNSDRHHGHFLLGRHWCSGALRPVLIDHAASFREDADVTMLHENAFQTGPVKCVAAGTYLRLRFLDCPTLLAEFSGLLSEAEIRGMSRRRDAILAYLDALVKQEGFEKVVRP